jgi:hypothetical protein
MKLMTCVCGARILRRGTLCPKCLAEYGADKSTWPEWLRYQVRDLLREANAECRYREEYLNEEWLRHVDDRYPSERRNDVGAAWSYIRNEMMPE